MANNVNRLPVLDTSDATATAAQILSGYTAYARGTKLTGSAVKESQYAYTVRRYGVKCTTAKSPCGIPSGSTMYENIEVSATTGNMALINPVTVYPTQTDPSPCIGKYIKIGINIFKPTSYKEWYQNGTTIYPVYYVDDVISYKLLRNVICTNAPTYPAETLIGNDFYQDIS